MSNSKYLDLLLLQYKPLHDTKQSIKKINNLLIKAKVPKNTVVVCPELSIQDYVCIRKNKKLFKGAIDISSSAIKSMREISIQFKIYLCITIFSKEKNNYFNKALIINPNGEIIQKYNKKSIPSEKCYQEKYYFNQPKNNFKFFDIGRFRIGILICWDQWYARSYEYMRKNNVNLILCPTAIGFCKIKNKNISLRGEREKWLNVITANSLMINTPVVICNRIGTESDKDHSISFWGSSFITDSSGTVVKRCLRDQRVIHHKIAIEDQITAKSMWNFIN